MKVCRSRREFLESPKNILGSGKSFFTCSEINVEKLKHKKIFDVLRNDYAPQLEFV